MRSRRPVKVPFLLPLGTFPFKHTLYYGSYLNMIVITDPISTCGSRSTLTNIPFHAVHMGILFLNLVAVPLTIVVILSVFCQHLFRERQTLGWQSVIIAQGGPLLL